MVNRIYHSELQFNKANVSDTEASFLDLHLSISHGFVDTEIYEKRGDFDSGIVNFPFLEGDVSRSTSYGFILLNLFVWFECPVMLITSNLFESNSQTRIKIS